MWSKNSETFYRTIAEGTTETKANIGITREKKQK